MKQTLSLRQSQRLAMTPQLQQAFRIMQLAAPELSAEVYAAVETNPMLELVEDDDETEDGGQEAEEIADEAPGDEAEPSETDFDEWPDAAAPADIPEELPVDVSWDDIYAPAGAGAPPSERDELPDRGAAGTLLEHLRWQLDVAPMSDRHRVAALAILDGIDEDGMLRAGARELLAVLAPLDFDAAEVEAVLERVQQFDPPGVAARDVAECLALQLRALPAQTPWREPALRAVERHFALIAKRDFAALARRLGADEDELAGVLALIRSLHPRPGAAIGDPQVEYVEPDVFAFRRDGRWRVALNDETLPRVRVHAAYAALVKRGDKTRDGQYLRDNLQDARWFLKNLEYRNDTLLAVAAEIVQRQQAFLERGPEAMRPLVLADVAQAVERHESTISRVTTRKYMDTPRGVFELKHFFSSHVAGAGGGEVSSTAIRARIRKLCAGEDPRKPLSDSRMTALLKASGINVARRTVAKYRESLAIPPSHERKRLA